MDDLKLIDIVYWLVFLTIASFLAKFAEAIGWGRFGFGVIAFSACVWLYIKLEPQRHKARLARETAALKGRAKKAAISVDSFLDRLREGGLSDPCSNESSVIEDIAVRMALNEGLLVPQTEPIDVTSVEHGRYRDRLKECIELGAIEGQFDAFMDDLLTLLTPSNTPVGDGIFIVERDLSPSEVAAIADFILSDGSHETMRKAKTAIHRNIQMQGCWPKDYKGDEPIVDAYLRGTPLAQLRTRCFKLKLEDRKQHTMIIGGSGAGKTNLIEYLIRCDLEEAMDELEGERRTIVVIDSQRQLIPKLARLPAPAQTITYLNPEWDLGLNLFDVDYHNIKGGVEAEAVINKTVGLIRFVLEGALEGGMTDRQRTLFDYAIQLIILIPKGNMITFIEMLADDGLSPYEDYISQFDKVTRDFFEKDWGSNDYKKTRAGVRARLQTLLKNPTFKRLFSATENRFKIYDELQSQLIILLDTHKPLLDKEGSSFLGRLYVAMIVQAAYQRFQHKGNAFPDVFVYIDEAHEYFDDRIAEMFEEVRKAGIGVILAHHDIDQIRKKPGLSPATVIGGTATKFVATTYQPDAVEMAKSMRVKADDILDLPVYTFGFYNRRIGFAPVSAPNNPLSGLISESKEGSLRLEMERRYGVGEKPVSQTKKPVVLPGVEPI